MAKNYAFLNQLLHAPEHFRDHIKHMTAAIVMSLTYGYDVKETDDPFILLADRVNKFTLEPLLPGAFLVNTLPFLKQFPEWLPGMGFKRHARYVFELGQEMINSPFEFVKENIRKGTARPSIVRECINLHEDGNMSPLDELTVKRAIVSVYAGGVETTAAAISTLFLVLALYPSVQQRAQAELDAVVGGDRLPEYDDRSRLPFIDAICQEILRWKPIAPLGLPHAAAEDDVYDGYFIPKGATVLGNVWAILHDPDIYPDPEVFDPDRFLTPDGQVKNDPVLTSVFGFGRRICPGRHLVDSTLWIAAASLLSAFNVCKAKDEHGDEIHIEAAYTDSSPSW
ncbi:hypothetical protein EWM64_g7032 [Hericium alpestre]|uniref:Cytochrome P450 n=1 Tax=Hericium alpestre TaxID=135208 RepID=A0A4Y9ZT37_9AGAM|nr:hypothetical protein EWM64_g7032 [Hericium alpestre]